VTERETLERGLTELGFAQLGLTPADATRAQLAARVQLIDALLAYVSELRLWNRTIDLVSSADDEQLIPRHILDSLAAVPLLRRLVEAAWREASEGASPPRRELSKNEQGFPRVADLGSGAGLPGIPVALTLPDIAMTLIERSGRRVGFLRSTTALLGLSRVRVLQAQAREVTESFDVLLLRACTALDARLLPDLRRMTRAGGMVIVYQGSSASAERSAELLRTDFGDVRRVPVEVPFLEAERHLVVARPD
jgi:16S rRNA (guanine527-N7)-methyltransferase